MARPRSGTATLTRDGHSISLKVLRLSRPSLAQQTPLAQSSTAKIPHTASLVYPSNSIDQDFILTSSLALPPSFGSAYVGDTFSCALVANNEVDVSTSESSAPNRSISNVRLVAEMQTPTQTFPLTLYAAPDIDQDVETASLRLSTSIQRIVTFHLREEGSHTLAVGVSYTEATTAASSSTKSQKLEVPESPKAATTDDTRHRTFRKMYQFASQPCLSVRTKATELPPLEIPDKSLGPYGRANLLRYALEAQLENVSDARIVLESARVLCRPPFRALSLNAGLSDHRDDDNDDHADRDKDDDRQNKLKSTMTTKPKSNNTDPIHLQPRDIHQLCFLLEQQANTAEGTDEIKQALKTDGRVVLGSIALEWRGSMGERGSLTTGNLMSRRR